MGGFGGKKLCNYIIISEGNIENFHRKWRKAPKALLEKEV